MKYWGVTRDITWLNIIGMNLNQIAFFFICIQGIAFVFYLLSSRFRLGNGLQALILISFFVMPVFSYAAFLAGIFDMPRIIEKKVVRFSTQGAEPCLKRCCQGGRKNLSS